MAVRFLEEDEKGETAVQWKLDITYLEDGSVDIGVASPTNCWSVFKLKTDGTFYRHQYIDNTSGFKLDKLGRIVEAKEEY